MITISRKISAHFHSTEFKCKCGCNKIKIDENLVNKVERIFSKLNASKCIVSSGYRCASYDKKIGGFVGRHAEGLAMDCVFYDRKGAIIPSKIVLCVAQDLGELRGMAKINNNYVHLDNRTSGKYMGDETKSNSTVTNNFYSYFGVSKAEVERYTGTTTTISYYTKYTGSSCSIVEALKTIGVNSSFSNRKTIANKNGISNYSGTASQNIKLLNLLKNGKLRK